MASAHRHLAMVAPDGVTYATLCGQAVSGGLAVDGYRPARGSVWEAAVRNGWHCVECARRLDAVRAGLETERHRGEPQREHDGRFMAARKL